MKQTELIAKVAEDVGVSQKTTAAILESLTRNIVDAIKGGDSITLSNFGSFSRVYRAARTGKNPRTGNSLEIRERYVPVFRASGAFRQQTKKQAELQAEQKASA